MPNPNGFSFLGFILVIFLLSAVIVGGSFYIKNYQPDLLKQAVATIPTPTKAITQTLVTCVDGIDGNTGDNFCSNYHGGESKCTPGFPNGYADSCSKTSNTHTSQPE